MKAIALTDNCNLYGAIEFYEKCINEGIKPIIGIDAYVAARTRHDKEGRLDTNRSRLILLAKNTIGYKNLIKLVTYAHLEGFYYKPRIDRELMEKYSEGLICISPSFSGEISQNLKVANKENAKGLLDFYNKIYGNENVYMELTRHGEIEGMEDLENSIIDFAREHKVKLVASQDVYYIKPDEYLARETLMSVQSSFGGSNRSTSKEEDFSFKTQKEMNKMFKDFPEALEHTQEIVNNCNLEITLRDWKFPDYKIESGRTQDEELKYLAYEGLKYRKMELTDEVKTRIEYELNIISTKGYSNYFLAVADLIRFANENKILSNTRGSAAGSLVSYLVGITIVDPLELRLPFERFLNPDRPSAPDVDMDFADSRRDEVIEYTRRKYGKDHVAQIGTFGTMLAKGSVRDAARAMGYEYEVGDKIAKLIPLGAQGFPMTIKRAMKEVKELKALYKADEEVQKVIDMAQKLEGCARHIGVHAAGVVISPRPLIEDVPIQFDPKGEGKLITQYDMHSVGEDGVGLLKFDFLGLKNLTIMGNTFKLVEKVYDVELKIEEIPLDDKETYDMLARGETGATFQLNGAGMTRFLKELKPTNIEDINAMVALYRPGPMAFIPDYIERKHDPSKVSYFDEKLKQFLEPTYGILIYQDDILLIAVNIAGYTWGEADKFRKAVGKKIPEEMEKQKSKFITGCVEVGGMSEDNTQKLWDMIETFAAYGFNKAHAASYGRISYLTSYLKANYPVLYMASVLTAEQGDVERAAEMVKECEKMQIEVMPPDINESFEDFASVGTERKIRFGLTTIKNFGEGIAHSIIEERKENGLFENLENFLNRVTDKNLNKKSLEALIKCGAMDTFGERGEMMENLEDMLAYNKEIARGPKDQGSLFGEAADIPPLRLKEFPPATKDQKLAWEKELLGLYISGNPLDKFRDQLDKRGKSISKIKKESKEEAMVVVAGIVENTKPIRTKKGAEMAFVKIKDFSDSIEVVAFPKIYEAYKEVLEPDNCIAIKGKISHRNGEISLLAEKVKRL
ncbi:MAG: DNA polymerase-3 subunit alpha [Candidatus Paceibacteria bacterium]|jgi:DNA polymerase-3 subunit alpha